MLFSSTLFLFAFLPLVLGGNFVLPPSWRNAWLLIASLFFYAWGEPFFVLVLLLSITMTWTCGLWVARDRSARFPLVATLVLNLGLLVLFKYADFFVATLSDLLLSIRILDAPLPTLARAWPADSPARAILFDANGHTRLPLGISFFTFQAISYVLDVRRGEVAPQRRWRDLALYKSLFPQLIAGPIVRYQDIESEIATRSVTVSDFAQGVRRFILGLGKKMLIANTVGECADHVFGVSADQLTPSVAWVGIVCYTAQIYFDFSGYSDMAIGIGRMLGFHIKENFAYPYVATSITDFWRRWHLSLSTWFRDYLYVPLGGNRRGRARTYFNLALVFALCGLWHGAASSFLVWGLFHGAFLVSERAGISRILEVMPRAVRHAYAMLVVMIGWVLFRASDLPHAISYLETMCGLRSASGIRSEVLTTAILLDAPLKLSLLAAIVAATPILPLATRAIEKREERGDVVPVVAARGFGMVATLAILVLCCLFMAAGTYNPFIYFRF